MNIAFVTDCYNTYIKKTQMDVLAKAHEVCVFFPENYNGSKPCDVQARVFESGFNEAMFQRYDIVVFSAAENWDVIIPVMTEVKGIAIIVEDSEAYKTVSQLTAAQIPPDCDVAETLGSLPKHIHWFDREVNLVYDRLELFGLLTDEVKTNFKNFYGIPLSKDWFKETVRTGDASI